MGLRRHEDRDARPARRRSGVASRMPRRSATARRRRRSSRRPGRSRRASNSIRCRNTGRLMPTGSVCWSASTMLPPWPAMNADRCDDPMVRAREQQRQWSRLDTVADVEARGQGRADGNRTARDAGEPLTAGRAVRPASSAAWRDGRARSGRRSPCAGARRGVTSTHSSSAELEGLLQGDRPWRHQLAKLSPEEARTLVSFFSLVGLTSMSSARAFSPMIMPS